MFGTITTQALAADSKVFIGEPLVSQFIRRLWRHAGSSSSLCACRKQVVKWTPRFKWGSAMFGHLIFLVLHSAFFYRMAPHGQEPEPRVDEFLFWIWVVSYIVHELYEGKQESSLRAYIYGSGNINDVRMRPECLRWFSNALHWGCVF
eukprot:SAG11_NODE_1040_length_6065_cov_2.701307_4_plen_148_part_00